MKIGFEKGREANAKINYREGFLIAQFPDLYLGNVACVWPQELPLLQKTTAVDYISSEEVADLYDEDEEFIGSIEPIKIEAGKVLANRSGLSSTPIKYIRL